MKIRVSMPGAVAAKEIEDVKAEMVFQKLLTELFKTEKKEKVKAPMLNIRYHNMGTVPEDEKKNTVETFEQTFDTYLEAKGVKNQNIVVGMTDTEGIDGILKYKGFLYLKCQKCGSVHGFCSKEQLAFYKCQDCGHKTPFHVPLVPLFVGCECGKRFKYMTNLTESEFDIKCIDCGTPVAVAWNGKKGIYEPMKG